MKKNFLILLVTTFLLVDLAQAQQPKKVPRIGYLSSGDAASESTRFEGIRLALRERGHIEGQSIASEYRYTAGKPDRLPELAAELVRLKVDIIVVAGGTTLVRAAKNETKTIPIVMTGGGGSRMLINHKRIAGLAIKSRFPSMYFTREFVDAGGLMSYGADRADIYQRVAYYVDRILKGAKPADLPVEQPTKFELVINLKTAKKIGLTIPPELLARANKLIK